SRGNEGNEKTPPPVGLWIVARGQIRYSDPWTEADSCGVTNVAALRSGLHTNGGPSAIDAPDPGLTTSGRNSGARPRNVSTVIGSSSRRRPVLTSIQCVRAKNGKFVLMRSLPPGEVAIAASPLKVNDSGAAVLISALACFAVNTSALETVREHVALKKTAWIGLVKSVGGTVPIVPGTTGEVIS